MDDENFGKIIKCNCQLHRPEDLARLAARSNLLPEDLERSIKDIRPIHFIKDGRLYSNREMLAAAREMVEKAHGFLYIWGSWGNAKTATLIAIINEINQAGRGPAIYMKFSKLIEYMRESYAVGRQRYIAESTYHQRFEYIKGIRILAIDEFDFSGKLRETEFAQEFRFDFLDDRYHQAQARRTATIFASNSPPESLPESIYSRLRDGRFRIIHNTAPDSRPAMGG